MSTRGGAHHTPARVVIARLDEVVVLGHAAKHELGGLIDSPIAFEQMLDRYVIEAAELANSLRSQIRKVRAA